MPVKRYVDNEMGPFVFGFYTRIYTTKEIPSWKALEKLSPEEQIRIVCGRYKLWILEHAQVMADKENTGFAILALTNSYFDMVSQLRGYVDEKVGSAKERTKLGIKVENNRDRVARGLREVFDELEDEDDLVNTLVYHVRHPMAHMGLTKDRIVLRDFRAFDDKSLADEPFVEITVRENELIFINPRIWVKRIVRDFNKLEDKLLNFDDPEAEDLRQKFLFRVRHSM
jgi:hypothetical protein